MSEGFHQTQNLMTIIQFTKRTIFLIALNMETTHLCSALFRQMTSHGNLDHFRPTCMVVGDTTFFFEMSSKKFSDVIES